MRGEPLCPFRFDVADAGKVDLRREFAINLQVPGAEMADPDNGDIEFFHMIGQKVVITGFSSWMNPPRKAKIV